MKMMRGLFLFCAAMSLVIIYGLCIGPSEILGQEAKIINFGVITPVSGAAAQWGISSSRSIMLNAWKINDQGGFKVKGEMYKWNVTVYDNKYVPSEGVKAANKAIFNDNVRFLNILGGSIALACLPIMKENKILSLNAAGGGRDLTNPDNPLVFRYNSAVEGMYAAFLPVLQKREGVKTMAVINPDDDTGRSGTVAAKWAADLVGMKIISEEYFQRGIKEFTPLLTKLIAKNPDLIDTSYTDPTSASLICKQARELGYKGTILLAWGPDVQNTLKIAGPHAEKAYLMTTGPIEPTTPVQKEFYDRFVKKFPANEWDALYWHHTEVVPSLTKAIVETQSFDPFVLAKHYQTMTWDSPVGTLRMGGSKLFGIKTQLIFPDTLFQIQNGKPVYIDTPAIPAGALD